MITFHDYERNQLIIGANVFMNAFIIQLYNPKVIIGLGLQFCFGFCNNRVVGVGLYI